ncbi:hypothetical protein [Candidatus Nitrospira bockiana]
MRTRTIDQVADAPRAPLYKTTLVIWTEFDPAPHDDQQLLALVAVGGARRSVRRRDHVPHPAKDPEWRESRDRSEWNELQPTEAWVFQTPSERNNFLVRRFPHREATETSGVYRVRGGYVVTGLLSAIYVREAEGSD